MEQNAKWLQWAVELQSLAQAGLTYSKDPYDIERFNRIREISAEILAHQSDMPLEKVRDLFCCESGYQTPKLDSRAAIIQGGKILLVQENDGRWAMPGGWVEVNLSIMENTIKEAREEAGVAVLPRRIVAVQEAERHCRMTYAHKVCKVFLLCTLLGGQFRKNFETVTSAWFTPDNLPPLAEEKSNAEQIRMCFDAYQAEHWETRFD